MKNINDETIHPISSKSFKRWTGRDCAHRLKNPVILVTGLCWIYPFLCLCFKRFFVLCNKKCLAGLFSFHKLTGLLQVSTLELDINHELDFQNVLLLELCAKSSRFWIWALNIECSLWAFVLNLFWIKSPSLYIKDLFVFECYNYNRVIVLI